MPKKKKVLHLGSEMTTVQVEDGMCKAYTVPIAKKQSEGWTFALNMNKWHYIVNGTSLCGRWFYLGSNFEDADPTVKTSDSCLTCYKKMSLRMLK
jgi:hypothetical protein